jgi:hypothetical protein
MLRPDKRTIWCKRVQDAIVKALLMPNGPVLTFHSNSPLNLIPRVISLIVDHLG